MGKTVFKLTEEDKEKIKELATKGLMDSEIAQMFNVTSGAIMYWRKKLNIKSKFSYEKIAKMDYKRFDELFKKGLTDSELARELNMSKDGIYSHRMHYDYYREYDNRYAISRPLSNFQKQVLIGTLLGDSCLRKEYTNPRLICGHGIKQKEYCRHKANIFESIGSKFTYRKRITPDPRNGVYYEMYVMTTPANPSLKEWYEQFYINGKKVIPMDLVKQYFTEVSLAYLFMDDGFKHKAGYSISTNCFTLEELNEFRKFLKEKFNLVTSMHRDNVTYIKSCSREHFEKLIYPYLHNDLKYKLISPYKTP